MLKILKENTTHVYRRCKPTSKLQRMYLEFKKLKKGRKSGTEWLKIKKQSMVDVFQG